MSEAAAEGRGRAEQRREKGETATEGRGRGREKSNGGEEREAVAEAERLSDWPPALGNSAATGHDFCSWRHWATGRWRHRANGRYRGSGCLRERWGSGRHAVKNI
jgi:hypothetical protein